MATVSPVLWLAGAGVTDGAAACDACRFSCRVASISARLDFAAIAGALTASSKAALLIRMVFMGFLRERIPC